MKQIIFSLLLFFSISVLAQENINIADANAVKRSITGSFTAISVTDGIDLYLTQGNEESVAVSASSRPLYV